MQSVTAEKARRLRTVALNVIALALGGLVAQGCFVAVEALIARNLGPEQYGIFGTVFSLSLAAVYLIEAGVNWRVIEIGSKQPNELPWLLGTALLVRVGLFALCYPLLLLILHALGYEAAAVQFFAVFFVYSLILVFHDTFAAVNSAQQRMHVSALFQASSPIAILALLLIIPLRDWQLTGVGVAYVGGAALIATVWFAVMWREQRPVVRVRSSVPLLKGGFLYGLAGLLDQLAQRMDILILSVMRPMGEVGLLVAAHRIFDVGVKVGIVGTRAVLPMLFKLNGENSSLYAEVAAVAVRFFATVGAALGLFVALSAEYLMQGIFGEQFAGAAVALQILGCALAVRFVTKGLEAMLMASKHQLKRTGSLAVAVLTNSALALALIPQIGIVGAAIARLGGCLAQLALSFGGANVPLPLWRVARLIAVPTAVAGVCFVAALLLPLAPAINILVALLAFPAVLLLLGYVKVAELRQLMPARKRRQSAAG